MGLLKRIIFEALLELKREKSCPLSGLIFFVKWGRRPRGVVLYTRLGLMGKVAFAAAHRTLVAHSSPPQNRISCGILTGLGSFFVIERGILRH